MGEDTPVTYLNFITLNTGAAERIAPPDATVTRAAALDLGRALRDGTTGVGEHPGYRLKALTVGPALLCTVYGNELPLTTFGVAARSRGSAKLWEILHASSQAYGLATDPLTPPASPWCAVRVEPTMMIDHNQPWRWLATYEVEIATAWVERRHHDA